MKATDIVIHLLEKYDHPEYGEQEKPEHWDELTPPIPDEDDPALFLQTAKNKLDSVKKIEVQGRVWWRRGYGGGEYCKAYVYVNDKLVHVTEEAYGGGDHYLTLATDWLVRSGYIKLGKYEPIWYLRDKHGLDLVYGKTEVRRERDL